MRICIDATPIGIHTTDKGGVYRYIHHLVEALSDIDMENQYTLFFNFFNKKNLPAFEQKLETLRLGQNFWVRHSRCPARVRDMFDLPIELLSGRFDVFHGCADRLPRLFSGRGVVTIHDVRYMEDLNESPEPRWIEMETLLPEEAIFDYMARDQLLESLRRTISKTVQRAAAIITVSEFSKKRITELLNVPKEVIKVVYHGVDSCFRAHSDAQIRMVLDRMRIKKPYILYTGKYDPLKNLLRLLRAFKTVSITKKDLTFVMVGPKNWFYFIVMEEAKNLEVIDRIYCTDFITDEDLAVLYCGALAFVLPSLYEGFGMPVIEAMACGTPVLTSNVCSLPEVAGDAAILIDPMSIEDITGAIIRIVEDDKLRNELIVRGVAHAASFTWERTARETLAVYEEKAV